MGEAGKAVQGGDTGGEGGAEQCADVKPLCGKEDAWPGGGVQG
jgi:hypothetical protein